ncbi:hypothetical protein LCGC14_3101070, partial [marine sediment metagenome]
GVTGHATFGDTVTIDGILGVTGWAFSGSTVTMHAQLGVTSHATFGDTVTLHGNFGVTGTATFVTGISNDSGFIMSSVADGGSAVAHTLNTDVAYASASALLLDIQNDGSSKLFVGQSGNMTADGTILTREFVGTVAEQAVNIASGVITITRGAILVDTQDEDATDDLDTITVDGAIGAGTGFLVVKAANSARTVVCKDGTGNLLLAGDFSLTHTHDVLFLAHSGGNWFEISRSDNGT